VAADELAALNNISNPNSILPGEILTIPHPTPQPGADQPTETIVTTYKVESGDTLASIASLYDVPFDQLAIFNGIAAPYVILPGDILEIPVGGHVVTEGENLNGIAQRYSVSLDVLIALNAGVHTSLPNDPNFILPGWFLQIPRETVAEGYNCDPDPEPRQGVITHTVSFGMELACLSRKFGVDVNTLAWANRAVIVDGGLQDGDVIKVPPADGALYEISENDIASETNVEVLMNWYGVTSPTAILTESGEPVTDPLDEVGQLLFIQGAYLLDGPYEPPVVVVATFPEGALGEGGEFIPPSDSTSGYIVPYGEVPPGAIRPKMTPWIGTTILDTGFCDYVSGAGWGTPIVWPVDSRTLHPGRAFGGAHGAVDIDSPIGSPVYAAAGGVVVWAGNSVYGAGNLIVLEHGGTFQTYYSHLSEVYVSCGQAVGPGAIIGAVGQTGQSTFPHLHFEVRYAGFAYDPMLYLP
jgi:murein DD-endopeptidase MepM/ murein hydrolase activator NlpD